MRRFCSTDCIHWLANHYNLQIDALRTSGQPFPMGTAQGKAFGQGLNNVPNEMITTMGAHGNLMSTTTEAQITAVTKAYRPTIYDIFKKYVVEGKVAGLARQSIDLLGIGDHIEVILTKR